MEICITDAVVSTITDVLLCVGTETTILSVQKMYFLRPVSECMWKDIEKYFFDKSVMMPATVRKKSILPYGKINSSVRKNQLFCMRCVFSVRKNQFFGTEKSLPYEKHNSSVRKNSILPYGKHTFSVRNKSTFDVWAVSHRVDLAHQHAAFCDENNHICCDTLLDGAQIMPCKHRSGQTKFHAYDFMPISQ